MRIFGAGCWALVLGSCWAASPALGQTGEDPARGGDMAGGLALNKQLDPDPDAPSPAVTTSMPEADFLVVPLRVHVLRTTELPAIHSKLTAKDVERVVGKVNAVWHKAGIHWALDPVVLESTTRARQFRTARQAETDRPLVPFKLLAPDDSKANEGVNLYYVHDFPINGVYFADRIAFVRDSARVRSIPGGIDEALARVTAHELGHALGLQHRQDENNLLSSGTSGVALNQLEVTRVRARAPKLPGATTVADLRRRLDEAKTKGDTAETNRLTTLLKPLAAPAAARPQ